MGTTRAQLRRWVLESVGEVLVCTATAAGTTTALTDVLNLYQQSGTLNGRLLVVVGASDANNVGREARVTGNDKATSTVTFAPALPAATAAGDEVELINENTLGFTNREFCSQLNLAIAMVQHVALDPATADGGTFDATAPVIDLPAGWSHFHTADWQDVDGVWATIGNADLRVDRVGRTVELRNDPRWRAHGRSVRLRGYTPAALLSADTDETNVFAPWLVAETAARLLLAVSKRGNTPEIMGRYAEQRRTADALLPMVQQARPTGRFVRLADA